MTTVAIPATKYRIESIDILRGLIIMIMALDHVRDFIHLGNINPTNLDKTTPILFFTRWITHFCAPTFVFLSGVSAHLAGTRRTASQFSAFLIKRGLWLILVDVTIMSFGFTFDPGFHFIVLEVLFAIGGSMLVLGLLTRAPLTVIGVLGAILVFGHNIFDYVTLPDMGTAGFLWKLFLTARGVVVPIDATHFLLIGYAMLPWTGLMLLGYTVGAMYKPGFDAARRKKILFRSGLAAIALFIVLRSFNIYGDPAPWSAQKTTALTVISFFNLSKYPPSLLYLCMTVGPGLLLLSAVEKTNNWLTRLFIVYGNVPFFFFVVHFYIIRIFQLVILYATGFSINDFLGKGPAFKPDTFGFDLLGVYGVWILLLITMYPLCRWYGNYKKMHRQWWLSYL